MGSGALPRSRLSAMAQMRYFACKALNWGSNEYPIGEEGFCVIFADGDTMKSVKWFPCDLFYQLFGEKLEGEF